MAQLHIVFENVNKFYFEGEMVRGKLEVNVENPCNVNNIFANLIGVSTCEGTFENSKLTASKFFTKHPSEKYFDDILTLFLAQNEEAGNWAAGTRCFSFEYQLPHSLPTSIESSEGFVRYTVHAVADIGGKTIKESEHFTVVSKTDLNKDVSAHLPCVLWKPDHQCFLQALFCMSNPIRAFVHVAKRGYVPGESMFINAEINNFHMFPIEWVKAKLVQVIKHNESKSFKERIVAEIVRGCILPSETQLWRSEIMAIPAIPPTTFPPKKLIGIKYKLLFQLKPSWKRKAIELKQRIIIGSVRLVECGQSGEQGQGEGIYSSEYFNSCNLEPCIFGPHNITEDEKSSVFSPLYPMYIAL